mmetsp:Transcript_52441/g.162813  ORF Transcript_52441/g.162813 Transcript_52441/m.162813 type:complete len:265 (-) Transcript_52441:359-1153(-)
MEKLASDLHQPWLKGSSNKTTIPCQEPRARTGLTRYPSNWLWVTLLFLNRQKHARMSVQGPVHLLAKAAACSLRNWRLVLQGPTRRTDMGQRSKTASDSHGPPATAPRSQEVFGQDGRPQAAAWADATAHLQPREERQVEVLPSAPELQGGSGGLVVPDAGECRKQPADALPRDGLQLRELRAAFHDGARQHLASLAVHDVVASTVRAQALPPRWLGERAPRQGNADASEAAVLLESRALPGAIDACPEGARLRRLRADAAGPR